ncbi:MAG: pyridoxamine 5'-phosphate oxidase family protein [Bdellovibrionota bacterium]
MTRDQLRNYLLKQSLGVVSSVSPEGDPQSALVGVAVTDSLEIIFDTLDTTRKVRNIRNHSRVSLVLGWNNESLMSPRARSSCD